MTNDDVRLRIDINADDKTFKLTDTTTYPTAASDYIVGVYQLLDADGSVLYKNADYDTPESVVSPDINYVEDIFASDFSMPLDTDGEIDSGQYTLGYKCNVPTTVTDTATTVNGTSPHTLEITMSSTEAADIVKLGVFEVKAHATTSLNQVYTIQSMTYGTTTATFVVNETVVTAIGGGSETVTIFTGITTYVVASKDFYYCYTAPTADIAMTVDCDTPKIVITDNTSYTSATNHSIPMELDTISGDLTLVPPQTPNVTATTTTATISASGTSLTELDVWTTAWQSYIQTECTWGVEAWSTTVTTKWYYITATVEGSDSMNVQCNSCTCDLNTCLYNLYLRWIAALANNPALEADLRLAIIKIITNWSMYKKAEACGDDTTVYCNNIKAVLAANDCECDTSTDSYPEQVTGSVTSTNVNKTHLVSGVPVSTLGQNTDVAISDNLKMYVKTSGAWVETLDFNVTDNQKTWQMSVPVSFETAKQTRYAINLNGDYNLLKIDVMCFDTLSADGTLQISVDSGVFTSGTISSGKALGSITNFWSGNIDMASETYIEAATSGTTTTGEFIVIYTFKSQ